MLRFWRPERSLAGLLLDGKRLEVALSRSAFMVLQLRSFNNLPVIGSNLLCWRVVYGVCRVLVPVQEYILSCWWTGIATLHAMDKVCAILSCWFGGKFITCKASIILISTASGVHAHCRFSAGRIANLSRHASLAESTWYFRLHTGNSWYPTIY